MTAEGRLERGEANYKANKFLNNPETIAYIAEIPKIEAKAKAAAKAEAAKIVAEEKAATKEAENAAPTE